MPPEPSLSLDPCEVLPPEIVHRIWSWMDYRTMAAASMVCKRWHPFCEDQLHWKRLCAEQGWTEPSESSAQASGKSAVDWHDLFKAERMLMHDWKAQRGKKFTLPHPDHQPEGHDGAIYTLQIYDKHLVSGGEDSTIRIWNLETHRLIGKPLRGHRDGIGCLQFSPRADEDVIVSGDGNGGLIFWRFSTPSIIKRISDAHRDAVIGLRFDKRFLVTASNDETIKIWDRRTLCENSFDGPSNTPPKPVTELRCRYVNAFDFSGDILVSASGDRCLKMWSISQGVCLRHIELPRALSCVNFDGQTIVIGGSEQSLRMHNRCLALRGKELVGHCDVVRTVHARVNGGNAIIASGSYDGSVRVWTKTENERWSCRTLRHARTSHTLQDAIQPSDSLSTGQVRQEKWVFGVHFDKRRLAYCSEASEIVGLDLN